MAAALGISSGAASQPHQIGVPAIEDIVHAVLARFLPATVDPLRHLTRFEVHPRNLLLTVKATSRQLSGEIHPDEQLTHNPDAPGTWRLTLPLALSRAAAKTVIMTRAPGRIRRDPSLIFALLAHDIQQAILAGSQPQQLNLAKLMAKQLPLDWDAQRRALGFDLHHDAAIA